MLYSVKRFNIVAWEKSYVAENFFNLIDNDRLILEMYAKHIDTNKVAKNFGFFGVSISQGLCSF